MNNIYILLADGFEEIEALTPADVLRRADFNVYLVSTNRDRIVKGSHNIVVECDILLDDVEVSNALMLILPGGMPGTLNLKNNKSVIDVILKFSDRDKWIGAICAAPMILGEMGLLDGKTVTCYPGYEKHLFNAKHIETPAVTDGKLITGRSAGAALDFSFEIVKQLAGQEKANELMSKMVTVK